MVLGLVQRQTHGGSRTAAGRAATAATGCEESGRTGDPAGPEEGTSREGTNSHEVLLSSSSGGRWVHRCGPGASAPCQFFPRVCPSVASTSPCCTRLPTGSTPLMPLYHRYHLHRFVDGHVLVSPPQGLSVPEPRPSITVGGLAVYGRGHGNSARAAAGRSRGTAPGRTPPSRAAA